MRINYNKYDFGNGWTVACGIKFSLREALKFWKWSIKKFYTGRGNCLVTSNVVISIHSTFEDANFVTGAQWVVKKVFGKFIRIHQLW